MKRQDKTVAVLGYGSQGRAIALNLRDSGYDLVIGLRSGSKTRRVAKADGFTRVLTIGKAVSAAQSVVVALPDHMHGRLFKQFILPNLNSGTTLVFLHGFSVHFGFVAPPDDSDLILLAPHAPGLAVREKFLTDRDLSAFFAVGQNHSGKARQTAITLAGGIGIARKRLVKSSFESEALGDLFGEQAILCGGMAELIQSGFELLVKKGIPAENAYLEVAYQLDLIINLIKRHGIEGMYNRISVAARFGSIRSGRKVIDASVRQNMASVYEEIASGRFAKLLNKLNDKDVAKLSQTIKRRVNPDFEKMARKYSK